MKTPGTLIIILATLASLAWGQTRPATTPAAPTTTAVPPAKIALVFPGLFNDEKEGITKLVAAYRQLNNEFRPKQQELEMLSKRIQTLGDEIRNLNAANASANAKAIQTKQEEGERFTRELEIKKKEAENAYQRRQSELLKPIIQEVRQALDAFAAAEGITMILDGDKLADNMLMMTPAMDVTRAFIVYFNRKNTTR